MGTVVVIAREIHAGSTAAAPGSAGRIASRPTGPQVHPPHLPPTYHKMRFEPTPGETMPSRSHVRG
ncbi:hypothetical protein JYU34_003820 [Plutella xylostella]|uniref:Uncharacterized protein n=1 Tax=Plutella xylostella TaxID=51655 RepID=A0ABQ7R100_PLUXY|nr:hypothetical protein JYU34_003820 [Plutella xylostella]